MEKMDSAIGFAGLGNMVGMASYRIAKNFDELPSAVRSLNRYGRRLTKAIKGIGNARGTRANAAVLAARADELG